LDHLDFDTPGQYEPVETPELEALARAYANDAVSSRTALIRDLLRDALDAWDQQRFHDEAKFVRDLFFAEDDGTPRKRSPKTLRDKVKDREALDEDAFSELRRARFRLFARFLVRFVMEQTTSDEQSARGHRPARLPWLIGAGVVVAAVVVGLSVWLATRTSESTAVFTFDDLGGGSPIIQVYPGGDRQTSRQDSERRVPARPDDNSAVQDSRTDGRLRPKRGGARETVGHLGPGSRRGRQDTLCNAGLRRH
jgi:hypothetical protein